MFIIQFHLYKKYGGVEQTEAHFRSFPPEKGGDNFETKILHPTSSTRQFFSVVVPSFMKGNHKSFGV